MRIAVGIIALVLGIVVTLQALAVFGLSNIANDQLTMESAAVAILMGALIFVGGAFSFGLAGLAQLIFVVCVLLSFVADDKVPDAALWRVACLVLALLLLFRGEKAAQQKQAEPNHARKTNDEPSGQFSNDHERVKCSDCAEWIMKDAKVCRFCGRIVPPS